LPSFCRPISWLANRQIEAMFSIEDEAAYEAIACLDTLGECDFSSPRLLSIRDVYLDSSDRLLLAEKPPSGVLGSGPLWQKIQAIAGEAFLPLLELLQDRRGSEIGRAGSRVEELCLGEVRFELGDRRTAWRELEIELGPEGTRAELVELFREKWGGLRVEPRSKFSRTLEYRRAPK
jgi:inorganic triphosphatase YgiF